MKKGIRQTDKKHKGKIPDKTTVDSSGLKFSFKYLDFQNPKFTLQHADDGHTTDFFKRLIHICQNNINDFVSTPNSHPIKWNHDRITEKAFPFDNDQLQDKAWQFPVNHIARIHGALVGEVFFIVWLDPAHQLFKRKL
jgi:hypothetical protein